MKIFEKLSKPALTFFLGILVASAVHYVLADNTSGTIYACVKKESGNIKIIKSTEKCSSSETLLTWNSQESASSSGTLVYSTSFDKNSDNNGTPMTLGNPNNMAPEVIKLINIPAGHYLVSGTIFSDSSDCSIYKSAFDSTPLITDWQNFGLVISFQEPYTLNQNGSISLYCGTDSQGDPFQVHKVVLNAVKIDTLVSSH